MNNKINWSLLIIICGLASVVGLRYIERLTNQSNSAAAGLTIIVPELSGTITLDLGYNAFLADCLWIKSLLYFSNTFRSYELPKADQTGPDQTKPESERRYLYRHVANYYQTVTSLSPHFYRAYQLGALTLLATGQMAEREAAENLLWKGIGQVRLDWTAGYFVKRESPEWQYHLLIADIARLQDDLEKESDAYLSALQSADCPEILADIWVALQERRVQTKLTEQELVRLRRQGWEELSKQLSADSIVAKYVELRLQSADR